MTHPFIKLLKEKIFDRYSLGVGQDKYQNNQYQIVKYHGDYTDQFFKDLEADLLLPVEKKNFHFSLKNNDFKAFKNLSVQSFIKERPTLEEFDNVFHSFYHNIPVNDLFNAVYIKSDFFGNAAKNSVFEPYISYFLQQNFTQKNLYPQDFLKTLRFNFYITDTNYPALKENLYTYLSQHVDFLREQIKNGYAQNKEKEIKEFEDSLYDSLKKFLKPDDMKQFNLFWPHILIQSNEKSMMSKINDVFVFDLNYSYLSDNFSQITNESIAKDTCQFIENTINNNFSDYLSASIIQHDTTCSRFILTYHKPFKNENMIDLFEKIIELKIKTNQFNSSYLREEYKTIQSQSIKDLNTQLNYMTMSNAFTSDKKINEKKLKI